MRRLLLDTHIWIWSVADPDRLSSRVRKAIEDPASELWLSPISTWEFLLLLERGRLAVSGKTRGPDEAVEEALRAGPFREASLTHAVARESRRIRLPHGDPADRFLAATARVHDLVLATADRRILDAKPCRLLPNR